LENGTHFLEIYSPNYDFHLVNNTLVNKKIRIDINQKGAIRAMVNTEERVLLNIPLKLSPIQKTEYFLVFFNILKFSRKENLLILWPYFQIQWFF
jgi:hypothetical protein